MCLLSITLIFNSCEKSITPHEIEELNIEKINTDSTVRTTLAIDSAQLEQLSSLPGGFDGPYTVSRTINVPSISSPIQAQGSIMISATIEYTYVVQQGGMKFLYSVNKISTRMQHTTNCYLRWTDLGSLYGPINIQDLDQRFVDYRIYGRITGSEGFFHNTNPANEIVEYRGSFNINLY